MVKLIWTLGFILNGTPNIQKMPPSEPMTLQDCRTLIAADVHRMHDWLRGALRAPLDFPVAVHGECEPVQQDATQRDD